MIKCKVLSSLYYNMCSYPMFKGVCCEHMSYIHNQSIDREVYKIIDLKLWFESDFENGAELVIKRVSGKGKYNFNKM